MCYGLFYDVSVTRCMRLGVVVLSKPAATAHDKADKNIELYSCFNREEINKTNVDASITEDEIN